MQYNNKTSVVMKWYRAERWFYLHKCHFLAKLIYHIIQLLFGCTIPYSAELAQGVNIAHFHGIVIHQASRIGKNTLLYQNVCLGGRNGKAGPVIGENCIIGAGACILGNITIGNNVKVGANSVVLESVPDGCTVVGVPGRIIRK